MEAAARRLRALGDLVASEYGPANRATLGFLKVMEAIRQLEEDLAAQATRDFPGHPSSGVRP
jgi:hypothetical protein